MRCEPYNMVPWNIPKHVKDVFCTWVSSVQISQMIRKWDISRFSSIFKVGHFKEKTREQISNRKLKVFDFGAFYDFRAYDFRAILHMFFGAFQGISCIRFSCKGLHKLRNSFQTRLDLHRTIYSRATTVTGQVRSCINLVATARHQLIRSSINIFD